MSSDMESRMQDQIEGAISENEQLRQENRGLRILAFLQHGNAEHLLYGDDGCMDCNTCRCDFKHDTPMELRNKISEYNLLKLGRAAQEALNKG